MMESDAISRVCPDAPAVDADGCAADPPAGGEYAGGWDGDDEGCWESDGDAAGGGDPDGDVCCCASAGTEPTATSAARVYTAILLFIENLPAGGMARPRRQLFGSPITQPECHRTPGAPV
jgi:hypothetical protein